METVVCEMCGKRVLRSAAAMAETHDHVAYFCGQACVERWTLERRPARRKLRDSRPRRETG